MASEVQNGGNVPVVPSYPPPPYFQMNRRIEIDTSSTRSFFTGLAKEVIILIILLLMVPHTDNTIVSESKTEAIQSFRYTFNKIFIKTSPFIHDLNCLNNILNFLHNEWQKFNDNETIELGNMPIGRCLDCIKNHIPPRSPEDLRELKHSSRYHLFPWETGGKYSFEKQFYNVDQLVALQMCQNIDNFLLIYDYKSRAKVFLPSSPSMYFYGETKENETKCYMSHFPYSSKCIAIRAVGFPKNLIYVTRTHMLQKFENINMDFSRPKRGLGFIPSLIIRLLREVLKGGTPANLLTKHIYNKITTKFKYNFDKEKVIKKTQRIKKYEFRHREFFKINELVKIQFMNSSGLTVICKDLRIFCQEKLQNYCMALNRLNYCLELVKEVHAYTIDQILAEKNYPPPFIENTVLLSQQGSHFLAGPRPVSLWNFRFKSKEEHSEEVFIGKVVNVDGQIKTLAPIVTSDPNISHSCLLALVQGQEYKNLCSYIPLNMRGVQELYANMYIRVIFIYLKEGYGQLFAKSASKFYVLRKYNIVVLGMAEEAKIMSQGSALIIDPKNEDSISGIGILSHDNIEETSEISVEIIVNTAITFALICSCFILYFIKIKCRKTHNRIINEESEGLTDNIELNNLNEDVS